MRKVSRLLSAAAAAAMAMAMPAIGAEPDNRFVQLAEIKIDPAQIEPYRAALRREIATSLRIEPGVLALYAVARENDPSRITILEVYAGNEAYAAHRQSAAFRRYKAVTAKMIQSLTLIPVAAVLLEGDKPSPRGER